jgi:hypothetical protein
MKRSLIIGVHLIADVLPDNTDESGGLLDANHIFKGARKLSDQCTQKHVSV